MASGLIEIIKVAAMEAIENSKPCDLRFGTVTSISPLKVQVTSDLILPESVLVVPKHLTDYSTDMYMGSKPEVSPGNVSMKVVEDTLVISTGVSVEQVSEEESTTEVTDSVDDRTVTVYNSLVVGDKVVLLRNQGGKQYYILDRI